MRAANTIRRHLAELVPGRYARDELSAGFLPSIETYAYRSPAADVPAVVTEDAPSPVVAAELTIRPEPVPIVTPVGEAQGEAPVDAPTDVPAEMPAEPQSQGEAP